MLEERHLRQFALRLRGVLGGTSRRGGIGRHDGEVGAAGGGSISALVSGSVGGLVSGSVMGSARVSTTGSVLDTVSASGNCVEESCLISSTRTSRSMVFLKSSVAFLNSPNALPRARPIAGSFFGPKTIKATMKMRIISGKPSEPN